MRCGGRCRTPYQRFHDSNCGPLQASRPILPPQRHYAHCYFALQGVSNRRMRATLGSRALPGANCRKPSLPVWRTPTRTAPLNCFWNAPQCQLRRLADGAGGMARWCVIDCGSCRLGAVQLPALKENAQRRQDRKQDKTVVQLDCGLLCLERPGEPSTSA